MGHLFKSRCPKDVVIYTQKQPSKTMEDHFMKKTKRKFSALKITIAAILCAAAISSVGIWDSHQQDDCTNHGESSLGVRRINTSELKSKLNELYQDPYGCTLYINTREAIRKYAMEHQLQSIPD